MSNFKCDFHMHSCYSIDGEYTIDALLTEAKKQSITHLALCDHNCMLGIDDLANKAKEFDIRVVPAIEFDSLFHNRETHIIGYNIDYHQEAFLHLHEEVNKMEFDAFEKKIEKLKTCFNIPLDTLPLLERCKSENPFQVIYGTFLNHPQVQDKEWAKPYLSGGKRYDNAVVNFYWDHCSYGHEAFVELPYPSAKSVIDKIHEANGIAILAHPGIHFYKKEALLYELTKMGIDGIEVFSSYHDEAENDFFYQYCKTHKLLISGGSDFHGSYKPNIEMGKYGLNNQSVLIPFLDKMFK